MGAQMNIPDKWVVIEVVSDKTKLHRVFACWYGGWAGADSWQLNSGIVGVDDQSKYFDFEGQSGSVYRCYKANYGSNMYGSSVLNNLIAKSKEKDIIITVLPEDTNWKELIDDTNVTSRDNQTKGRE
jgi:hypothetical protein